MSAFTRNSVKAHTYYTIIKHALLLKSHMSNISYKAYMGKAIICHTLTTSTVIVVLYSCMVTMLCYIQPAITFSLNCGLSSYSYTYLL